MGNLSELGKRLWIEMQVSTPPFVQRTLIPRLHTAKEFARVLARPYLTLYELQGQGQEGPLSVVYAGLGYARPMLESLLFVEAPQAREIGRLPPWRLHEVSRLPDSDLVIVEATKHLIDRLPRQQALVLPWWIDLILDVRGDWESLKQRFHRSVRGQDLRRVRKFGYEYDVSHRDEDFEAFYHKMYLPSMEARHGGLSAPLPQDEAYQYFRHGWLLMLRREGRYVAGCICYAQGDAVKFREIGVLDGDLQLMREGAQGAVYYAMVHWANQQGYAAVDFLGSWPYMSSGIFRYKRKWGSAVSLSPHEHKRIWIKIQRATPAVCRFLEHNPCVVIDAEGKLHGLIVTPDPDGVTAEMEAKWRSLYETPGLENLLIRSPLDLVEGPIRSNGRH
ncbi:MAG: GNAT family N-acetyltransferase [Anaerolineae bacterium]